MKFLTNLLQLFIICGGWSALGERFDWVLQNVSILQYENSGINYVIFPWLYETGVEPSFVVWYFNKTPIAKRDSTGFNGIRPYTNRTRYITEGRCGTTLTSGCLQLSHPQKVDDGEYALRVSVSQQPMFIGFGVLNSIVFNSSARVEYLDEHCQWRLNHQNLHLIRSPPYIYDVSNFTNANFSVECDSSKVPAAFITVSLNNVNQSGCQGIPDTQCHINSLELIPGNLSILFAYKEAVNPRYVATFYAKSKLINSSSDQNVTIRSSLSIECTFSGYPEPSIKWHHNGTNRPSTDALVITNNVMQENGYIFKRSIITWRSDADQTAKKSIGGSYRCTTHDHWNASYSRTVIINIQYGPLTMDVTGENDVIEHSPARVSCLADCNPACSYTWKNLTSGQIISNKTRLTINSTRYDHGEYECTADNDVWQNKTKFSLSVYYSPKIELSITNNGFLVQGNNTELKCTVHSRPESHVVMKNMTDGSILRALTNNQAMYTITHTDCLHTGNYSCKANNTIFGIGHEDKRTIFMDVKCPPRLSYRDEDGAISIGANHSFELHLISNPLIKLSKQNWTFVEERSNHTSKFPENVIINDVTADQRFQTKQVLHIINTTEHNFGTYILSTTNGYGRIASFKFRLGPKGPPQEPYALQLVHATAVSLTFNWTAGFNGGFEQNFSILYRKDNANNGLELSADVHHSEDASSGDVVVYKLKDPQNILPDTAYSIRIKARNHYNGSSEVYGKDSVFRTKVRPVLSEQFVEINTTHAVIKATIQETESVTHVITTVCTLEKDSTCSEKSTPVSQSDIFVILELKAKAKKYNVSFALFDLHDEVNHVSMLVSTKSGGLSLMVKAGIGGGVAIAVLIILIITGVLCCRRYKKTKKKRSRESHPTERIDEVGTSEMDNGPSTTNGKKKNIPLDDIPYEDTEIKSGILVTKFAAYVDQILQTKKPFEQEYGSLPQDQQFEWTAALRDDDLKDKNRFKNILPYDKNRVELLTRQGYPLSDYINASYIKGYSSKDKYIATLGPMPETVNDFWRMVWEKDVPLIVMLTNCRELGGKKKCEQYWPVTIGAGPVFHSNIKINMIKEDIWLDYTIRTFTLKKKGEERTVYHCHYTSWPDHGVPDCGTALIAFRGIVVKKMIPNRYTIMHCSAGVGRTGTLIALDYLIKQGEQEKHVDVFACVKQLRMQRVHMIQTLAQYVFLHEALSEYFSAGPTNIPCVDFINTYTKITKPVRSGLSKITMEMKELDKLSPTIREADQDYPHEGVNFDKNQDPSIIPLLSSRVFLSSRVPDRNDYINAVYVSTLQRKNAFIVTQVPLEDTVIDFWRLIMEFNSSTIVLLATDQQYKMMPKFIPISENQCVTLNGITARWIGETLKKGFTELEIDISTASPMENVYMNAPHVVQSGEAASIQNKSMRLFCVNLAKNKPCLDPVTTLSLITEVNHWQDTGAQVPIVVVCWDGATYSGQFVASYSLVEMMSAEQEVDVFRVVKQIRDRRPQFINNMEQYKGLYEVVKQYIKRDNVYVNVI